MMNEISALDWKTPVGILGLNQPGRESGNAAACAGKDIPWLQEMAGDGIWHGWGFEYRDVVILDKNNVPITVYNLTDHGLSAPANYEELKALLKAAANP